MFDTSVPRTSRPDIFSVYQKTGAPDMLYILFGVDRIFVERLHCIAILFNNIVRP